LTEQYDRNLYEKMPALTRLQKHVGKNPDPAASRRGEVTQGKPGVASIACAAGHYGCLNTDTDVVTLTFDLLTPK